MSAESRLPEECSNEFKNLLSPDAAPEEPDDLRRWNRTPRPYRHERDELRQYDKYGRGEASSRPSTPPTGQGSAAASESGTEADDERPAFIRALPAPHDRPRKGLKTGEADQDVLLTPSQLDDEGRRLSVDYFRSRKGGKLGKEVDAREEAENEQKEQQRLLKIRIAEFARRSSEVGLMAVIIASVLCGRGVWDQAVRWRWELASHLLIVAALILAYPVKLSIVDTQSQAKKLWQRFRVPASFDPATVLYPPLLPVLVALSVSPANPAAILPNIILGLASLPQRLFPRSSRLGVMNELHWLVSIAPLILAEGTLWSSSKQLRSHWAMSCPSSSGLCAETLVSLYPLHHALMMPLQYLTTTSLLISELHLLAVSLINLLLLATSPQSVIVKACLWVGGVALFVACAPVLHWNVTLMRVPKWKLRRPGHTAEERKSLVDAVSDLINVQRATAAFRPAAAEDSDADEDEPSTTIKRSMTSAHKAAKSLYKVNTIAGSASQEPQSAIEPHTNGTFPELSNSVGRPRRNTLPPREAPSLAPREASSKRKARSTSMLWYLHLTPAQAVRRKWIYAGYVYFAIAVIIAIPVRLYVSKHALRNYEPVGWALSYLFSQLPPVYDILRSSGLDIWLPLPPSTFTWPKLDETFPLDVPVLRDEVGAANIRLALIAYWALVLLTGLLAVFSLTALVEVDTRRKVFHGVMVAMLLPSTFVDPCACALALALILAVFLLLEVIRAGQVPPLGNAIGRFVAPYVDGRDLRGPVVVSHIFLLIGCAVPLWFSLASIDRAGVLPWQGWELVDNQREVAMLAGVICVGMGDAAASLIGRRYGRHKWPWVGGKSLEGSAAFAAAVTVGLLFGKAWLVAGGWQDVTSSFAGHLGDQGASHCAFAWIVTLLKAVFCGSGASFMEAVLTGANDNVVVPVALWLLVKGLRV